MNEKQDGPYRYEYKGPPRDKKSKEEIQKEITEFAVSILKNQMSAERIHKVLEKLFNGGLSASESLDLLNRITLNLIIEG
jgi:predicted transcriptional regulator